MPEAKVVSEEEDTIRRIQTGWRGSQELGAQITVVTCTETTDLPVYCTWETFGLPGMKLTWKYDCERPTSVQRLSNGNTLIASPSANRAIEVDPDGQVVWEYNAKDQLRVARIYHR